MTTLDYKSISNTRYKNRQYTARGGGIGPPAGMVSAAALQIFWGARAFALSGAPNVRRRLQRAVTLRTRVNAQRAKISPRARALHPPPPPRQRRKISPPPVDSTAGRAVDQPRPRLLPTPSPRAIAPRPRRRRCSLFPPLSAPPLPWRRACCQHGAAKTLASLLPRYALPPAAIIFSQFFRTS
jgi:hypothetical protein